MSASRALGLGLGFAADRLLGDPRRFHPVAGFGTLAAALERAGYADSRPAGVRHTVLLVGGAALVGVAAEAVTARRPVLHTLVTAAATWTVLGGRSLEREAMAVHDLLAGGDLAGARGRVQHLVGRVTDDLDADGIARAVVESVAENTSDAVTAPLVWGAVAGVPGLLAHRAVNTLDAMVGHRTPRLERFGWASARLDDLLNLPGSRWAALCVAAADPVHAGAVLAAWRRDARAHPSPNAGVVESAFAGALGIRLGGRTVYGTRVEERPTMGSGRPVRTSDVPRATALARRVGWLAALGAVLGAAASGASGRRWS